MTVKQSNTFWPLVKKLGKLLERRQRGETPGLFQDMLRGVVR